MFHKFKISTCVFILCLFGLTLMTVTPVFAVDDDSFTVCDNKPEAEEKLSCFREIVRTQRQGMENLSKASRSQEAIVDEAVSKSADLVATLEAQIADLQSQLTAVKLHQEDVDAENALLHADVKTLTAERDAMQEQVTKVAATRDTMIADLQSQLAAAESASKAAEVQIADLQSQLTAAQSGSQDAAKAAEKVELLLAFLQKQGSGDTSTIQIHKNYGHGGEEVRKNWNKCRGCVISPEEMQALTARLKD